MVKKTNKKKQSNNRIIKFSYDYNKEFSELDSALNKTKLIRFQQIIYSVVVLLLLSPMFFNGSVSLNYYVSVAIFCMFGLMFTVYLAQSNRILVLLTQIKDTLNKK